MHHLRFALFICVIFGFISAGAISFPEKNERFVKAATGIIIFPEAKMASNTQAVKLQVITDNIIGFITAPYKLLQEKCNRPHGTLVSLNIKDQKQYSLATKYKTATIVNFFYSPLIVCYEIN